MKRLALAAIFLILPFTSFAQEDHDHIEFPADTLLALEGQDAISKEACFLFITDLGYKGSETPENFYATVLNSYAHGADSSLPITVQALPKQNSVLAGTAANGKDQIAIFLASGELDLRNAQSFNLKWLHGNHFHTNRCVNLQVHQH